MAVKIRKPYEAHQRLRFDTGEESRTKQSFKEESDINTIMKQYLKTGVLDHVKDRPGLFLDLPESIDYQSAMNIVIEAGKKFDDLPGSVRKRFDNSAVAFLDFMNDPENIEESVELGLREKVEEVIEPMLDPPDSPVEEPTAPPE